MVGAFITATPERGWVEDQPQQIALEKKSDHEAGLRALRLVLRTQSRSNNLGMLRVALLVGGGQNSLM